MTFREEVYYRWKLIELCIRKSPLVRGVLGVIVLIVVATVIEIIRNVSP